MYTYLSSRSWPREIKTYWWKRVGRNRGWFNSLIPTREDHILGFSLVLTLCIYLCIALEIQTPHFPAPTDNGGGSLSLPPTTHYGIEYRTQSNSIQCSLLWIRQTNLASVAQITYWVQGPCGLYLHQSRQHSWHMNSTPCHQNLPRSCDYHPRFTRDARVLNVQSGRWQYAFRLPPQLRALHHLFLGKRSQGVFYFRPSYPPHGKLFMFSDTFTSPKQQM